MLNYRFAKKEEVNNIKKLLLENDLPVEGVEQFSKNFIATWNGNLIGAVWLEKYQWNGCTPTIIYGERRFTQNHGDRELEQLNFDLKNKRCFGQSNAYFLRKEFYNFN